MLVCIFRMLRDKIHILRMDLIIFLYDTEI